jgi:quercetin dioxygenase-like cupin family protein
MNRTTRCCLTALLAPSLFWLPGSASADAAAETPSGISRQPLLSKEMSLPSGQIKTNVIRVHFAPGYKTPLHTHEGAGPRYVLKGHLKVTDSGKTETFGPGDVFWETGQAMTVENVGGSDAEMVIFEALPVK